MADKNLDDPYDLRKGELYLFINNSKESELALEYLRLQGLNPNVMRPPENDSFLNISLEPSPLFTNSFHEPEIPSLVIQHSPYYICPFVYISFSGVKAFLRGNIISDISKVRGYWRNIKTFYSDYDYNKKTGFVKQQKLVTCFDKDKKVIFEGPIEKAPYNLIEHLEAHDYKSWHEVSSWLIGDIDKLFKKQKGLEPIIDKETSTVLFPDELEILRKGKRVITIDSRSAYHVIYQAYFNHNGVLFGVYANIYD